MYTFKMLYVWEIGAFGALCRLVAVVDIDALSTQRTGVNPGEHNEKFPRVSFSRCSSTVSNEKILLA